MAKGFRGRAKNCITVARPRVEKVPLLYVFHHRSQPALTAYAMLQGLQYAYRDRRTKRREFRSLWIARINAGVRRELLRAHCSGVPSELFYPHSAEHGYTYSRFTHQQNQASIVMNRKILSELAVYEPYSFKAIVDVAKAVEANGDEQRTEEICAGLRAIELPSFSESTDSLAR